MSDSGARTSGMGSPYRGLMPYSEQDARFFFGREPEREIIGANLIASRLTLLYGASGVGKSSVLHAGVGHGLLDEARRNRRIYGKPEHAVVIFSDWRGDVLANLVEKVKIAIAESLGEQRFLATGSRPLADVLRQQSEFLDGDLLIVLDQFEEYFLYHAGEDGEGTFTDELSRAINTPDLRANFMISIREDALAKLDRFKGRIPGLFDNYLRVEHLHRDAARQAIERPVAVLNMELPEDGRFQMEPGLVDAVLDQVQTGKVVIGDAGGTGTSGTGDTRIETPFLQLVMTRLWNEEVAAGSRVLRLATLERLGGAERIVRSHLDATMSALSADDRETAARVFRHLVTPSGSKIAHNIVDLAEYTGVSQERLAPLLEKLSGGEVRIIRPVASADGRPQNTGYEIFHDVLAAAILDWRRRYAAVQEQERIRRESEERMATEQAEAKRLAEQKRSKLLRIGSVVLLLLLAGMTYLAVTAIESRNEAELSFAKWKKAEKKADSSEDIAEAEKDRAEERLTVINKIVGSTRGEIYDRAGSDSVLATTLFHAVQNDTMLRSAINVEELPPRVFIHIQSASQKRLAHRIENALESAKYHVPGTEVLAIGFGKTADVRYFRQSDAQDANRIVAILMGAGVIDAHAILRKLERSKSLPSQQFEVWIPVSSGSGGTTPGRDSLVIAPGTIKQTLPGVLSRDVTTKSTTSGTKDTGSSTSRLRTTIRKR